MTSEERPEIASFGFSGVGNVRQDNQDAIRFCRRDDLTEKYGHLYGIADGMGGYAHGAVASSLALELLFETYYRSNGLSVKEKLRQAVQHANVGVCQASERMAAGRMGTTLTAVHLQGDTLSMAHVGDSRAYLIRERKATCLTNDHTQVGDMVRMRLIGPDRVRTHAQRSMLNRCLGVNLFVTPDITRVPVRTGDIILLCTDGIWSVVQDQEFADLASRAEGPEDLCRNVFDLAMGRESDDNLSVIALYVQRVGSADAPGGLGERLRGFLRVLKGGGRSP